MTLDGYVLKVLINNSKAICIFHQPSTIITIKQFLIKDFIMRYSLLLAVLMFLSCNPQELIAQACGTIVTPEQEAYYNRYAREMDAFDGALTRGIRDFPLKVHIMRKSDGTGGMGKFSLRQAINKLNAYYVHANIRFVILDDIHYVDDDDYYDFNTDDEEKFCSENDKSDVINIYFFNSIRTGLHTLCGYAYFPDGKDRVLMTNTCALNGSTLAHEFGHYFMLYHTHGKSNTGSTDELVDGSNCTSAGDKVCDTPPDPNLSGKVTNDCVYTGTGRDRNGQAYNPDTYNMMSYSPKNCRQHFSKGQYARINYTALHHREYLKFPPSRPSGEAGTKIKTMLSGELVLDIAGQTIKTKLDNNLYKSVDGYYSGTNYKLSIINNEPAYVYVISSDLTKENNLLFPLEGQSAYLPMKGAKVALPGGDYMFQMDDTKGKDYICVLYSKKPLKIQEVLLKLKYKTGTFMQRLYKTLGEEVVPLNQIEYSTTGQLSFSAASTGKTIVPIVVEMDHR